MVIPQILDTEADLLPRDLRGKMDVNPLFEPSKIQDYFL
jgi:hypothetical protein